jgi:hypothetical protein
VTEGRVVALLLVEVVVVVAGVTASPSLLMPLKLTDLPIKRSLLQSESGIDDEDGVDEEVPLTMVVEVVVVTVIIMISLRVWRSTNLWLGLFCLFR